jgi:hypothetical protein
MAVSFIAPIILVVVLALIIIIITTAVKVSATEGGEPVLKSVYIYLVLFATLMMTIGGSVAAFMAVADIVAPAPYHQSFEEYRQWGIDKTELGTTEKAQLSEADIKVRYDAMVAAENDRQMTRAKNNLIKSLGWIIIPLPVFIYYQRRLKDKEV